MDIGYSIQGTYFYLHPSYICVMQVPAINAIPFNVVALLRQLQREEEKLTAFYIWAHFWCSRSVLVPLAVQAQQTPTKGPLNSQTECSNSSSSSCATGQSVAPASSLALVTNGS